jgi:hypothetical protein
MAALRNAARLCGPCPFFTWHLSSPSETSRTQWRRFSIPQGPRQWVRRNSASAFSRERLLMAYWISTVVRPWHRVVRSRRQTCFRAGQSICPARRVLVCRCRRTVRPCPLESVCVSDSDARRRLSVAGGKAGLKIRDHGSFQLRLIVLDDEQVVAAAIDNFFAQLALAKHRVAGNQPAL